MRNPSGIRDDFLVRDEQRLGAGRPGIIDDITVRPDGTVPGSIDWDAVAKIKLEESWAALGGEASALGLPLSSHLDISKAGDTYTLACRGGLLHYMNGAIRVEEAPRVRVTFEGLILYSRQETSPDEIYGGFGYRIPSIVEGDRVKTSNFVIPELKLGGKDERNTRVWPYSQQIYEGPPVKMELFVSIAEHDSGDREKVRNDIRNLIDSGSRDIVAALGAGMGIPAALGREGGSGAYMEETKTFLAGLIEEVFGLADDVYNPGALAIEWEEMADPAPVQVATHPIDSKAITYTHRIDMSGIDDSGAVGNIAAFFRVWR